MRNKMLRLLTAALALLLIAVTPVAALPFDPNLYTSYNYSSSGEVVSTPAAYTPAWQIRSETLSGGEVFSIADIVADDTYLYVLDGTNGRIYVLDGERKIVRCLDGVTGSQVSNTLSKPEGMFLRDGLLYIADTANNRIVVCDTEGHVTREYADPHIKVLSEDVDFFPSRLCVNDSGRIFVVAKNVNRGLVELNEDGTWGGFIGAPKVKVDWSTYFYRLIATEEQLRRMQSFVPTEYNSVDMDPEGFVYGTIGSVSTGEIQKVINSGDTSGSSTPIRRLNASGDDILSRSGFFAPVGDVSFDSADGCSTIVDVAVYKNGIYTLLDSRRGHIFTYDQSGNLLYILGGMGDQIGCFSAAGAVAYWNDQLVVADKSGVLNIFTVTDYGRCINTAVIADYEGDYETCDRYWNLALNYDANLYAAYIGKGKAEYRQGNYQKAMEYYKAVGESDYYSKAKAKFRQQWLEQNALVVGVALVLLLALLMYWFFRRSDKGTGHHHG